MTARDVRNPSLPFAAACVVLIGLTDGLLTKPSAWTAQLARPDWHPPAAAFGPIWAVIGFCAVFAFAKAWDTLSNPDDRRTFLGLVALNAVLNVAWSALFFAGQRPDLALADIALLWASIAALILFIVRRGVTSSAMLLAPYLVWVAAAAALNYEIVRLNGLI